MFAPTRHSVIDPDVFDAATVDNMLIIHDFAHGVTNTPTDAERIIRPWLDADARTLRHQEAPAA